MLLVLLPACGDRFEGMLLLTGNFEFLVDGGKIVEFVRHFSSPVEGGRIFEHQLTEYLIDAVELLEAGSTVQQSEGILADFKEAAQVCQIFLFVRRDVQVRRLSCKLLERSSTP